MRYNMPTTKTIRDVDTYTFVWTRNKYIILFTNFLHEDPTVGIWYLYNVCVYVYMRECVCIHIILCRYISNTDAELSNYI